MQVGALQALVAVLGNRVVDGVAGREGGGRYQGGEHEADDHEAGLHAAAGDVAQAHAEHVAGADEDE